MDKLYSFGLSELFLLIALAAAKKYKEQQHVERGFAFLKDPLFFA